MRRRARLPDHVVDVAAAADPVAAVLDAHGRGDLLALRTSGTAGRVRAVVRSTASWFDSFDEVTRLLGMDRASRVWLPGPLASTMNLFAAVHAASVGAAVQQTASGATHAVLTPAALSRTLASGSDLVGVHVLVAGDRLSPARHVEALGRGASAVSHYYGAAELSFVAWGSHAGDLRPFPGVEVDCRDDVVWVRSPYVCEGYAGSDGPLVRGSDGFVTVGDRGRIMAGTLRLLGRAEQTVVTAGATVLVGDVEETLESATGHRVTVVGLPHPDLGEVLCGVVPDAAAVPALREAARRLLEAAQRPRRWFELTDLPLTDAGKLDRRQLAERLRSGAPS